MAVSFAAFSSKVSVNILVLVLAVVFSIVPFSMVYHLGFVLFSVSWLFDSILCVFSELFLKKGKKHLSECFLFLRHAGVGVNRCWGGDLGIFCFSS